MNGKFVISLDFELHWGVFDNRTVNSYKNNLLQTRTVIDKMLELADKYGIKLTFSAVGFLFAESKSELIQYFPKNKPSYTNNKLSPYAILDSIGHSEKEDPYHFAKSVIKKIHNNGNHEIGSHTFSHYYCHEKGQTLKQFNEDISSAVSIAKSMGIKLQSIVFPRNMINTENELDKEYLDICYKHGIKSFRGKENSILYNLHNSKFYSNWYIIRIFRFLDAYLNLSGYNTYSLQRIHKENNVINLPSSRLLRAYTKKLSFLEPLKLRRIKKPMMHAARNNELFHLWWHPHNFGVNTDENFKNLEEIFNMYHKLNKNYNFQSMTMTELTDQLSKKN
jgi:hypothetical protein